MLHALDAVVVEIYVSDFDFGWQAVGLHRKAVIVRSNLDVAVAEILDRLIAAAMTKHQFESLAAKGASQQLMAKTNAEGRHA